MGRKSLLFALIAGSLLLSFAPEVLARIWTDRSGRPIEADFVRIDGADVILLRQGKEIRIPLTRLCDADQAYAKTAKPPSSGGNEDPFDSGGKSSGNNPIENGKRDGDKPSKGDEDEDDNERQKTGKYPLRSWRDRSSKQVKARFIAVQGQDVVLEQNNGKRLNVPFHTLVENDQEYVEKELKKAGTAHLTPSRAAPLGPGPVQSTAPPGGYAPQGGYSPPASGPDDFRGSLPPKAPSGGPPGGYGSPPSGAPPNYSTPPGSGGPGMGPGVGPPGSRGGPPAAFDGPPAGFGPGSGPPGYSSPPGGAGSLPSSPGPGYETPPGGAPPGSYSSPPSGAPPGGFGAPSSSSAPPDAPGAFNNPPSGGYAPPANRGISPPNFPSSLPLPGSRFEQIYQCSNCKKDMPKGFNIKAGDKCPHCGTYFLYKEDAFGRKEYAPGRFPVGLFAIGGGGLTAIAVFIGIVIRGIICAVRD